MLSKIGVYVDFDQPVRPVPEEMPALLQPHRWTSAEFFDMVGRFPENDEIDRLNCVEWGFPGHYLCGFCDEHQVPRFVCGCEVVCQIGAESEPSPLVWVSFEHEQAQLSVERVLFMPNLFTFPTVETELRKLLGEQAGPLTAAKTQNIVRSFLTWMVSADYLRRDSRWNNRWAYSGAPVLQRREL